MYSFKPSGCSRKGALGISIRTRQITNGRLNLCDSTQPSYFRKLFPPIKQAFLVQTRAIEHFFVGGCLYCAIRQVLLEHNWNSSVFHSIICGSLVGGYQTGLKRSWKSSFRQVRFIVGLGLLQEATLAVLLKIHLISDRPVRFVSLDYDPLVYIVGAVGACVVGLFTKSFVQDIPQLPLNEDDADEDSDNIAFFKYLLGRLCNNIITEVIIEVRRERRFFLGGSLAWTAEHLCQKAGIKSRAAIVTVAGGIVGAYFGTYGDEANHVVISSFGVASAGLVYGTFVDSQILKDGHPKEMSGLCLILFPLFYSILG